MRRYEVVEREIVKKEECVKMSCDLCGRVAEHPRDETFVWGGCGIGQGSLEAKYSIDGEYNLDTLDLCYDCAKWLMKQIRQRKIQRLEDHY